MIGRTLGKYRILSEIGKGKGGMGVVYLAEHVVLRKRFAVKCLSQELSRDPGFRQRFDEEAHRQALLSDPNIVQVTDFFDVGGQFFLVMEYVEGGDLADLIKKHGQLPEAKALDILRDILRGLAFAHGQGLVHRDLKPSNVLVDKSDRARIMDFGISIMAGGANKSRTATGIMIGSPWYMSPEQIKTPREVDQRADLYAVGIVLYEMLTGRLPFDGETEFKVMEQQVHDPVPNPRALNSKVTARVVRIILKAMAKDPADRFQSCSELIAAIDQTPPVIPEPIVEAVRHVSRWSRGTKVAAVLVAVVAVGTTTVYLTSRTTDPSVIVVDPPPTPGAVETSTRPIVTPVPLPIPPTPPLPDRCEAAVVSAERAYSAHRFDETIKIASEHPLVAMGLCGPRLDTLKQAALRAKTEASR
jgi:serine/threonine protein kinase